MCDNILGDDPACLLDELQNNFPQAELVGANQEFENWLPKSLVLLNCQHNPLALPLDIQGTVFQQKFKRVLLDIPFWLYLMTYQEIAQKLVRQNLIEQWRMPFAASNKLAVAIPLPSSYPDKMVKYLDNVGELSAKKKLLQREKSFIIRMID